MKRKQRNIIIGFGVAGMIILWSAVVAILPLVILKACILFLMG